MRNSLSWNGNVVYFNEIPTLIVFLGGLIVISSIYLLNKLDESED